MLAVMHFALCILTLFTAFVVSLLTQQAIGAAYARCVLRSTIKKVAILDFDVHHGNGTEACVRNLVPSLRSQVSHFNMHPFTHGVVDWWI